MIADTNEFVKQTKHNRSDIINSLSLLHHKRCLNLRLEVSHKHLFGYKYISITGRLLQTSVFVGLMYSADWTRGLDLRTGTKQETGHHPQQFSLQKTILLIALYLTNVLLLQLRIKMPMSLLIVCIK